MKLERAIIDQLESNLRDFRTIDDLVGKNGLIKRLVKKLIDQLLQEELIYNFRL
ncbi:MAG: hypothetical protein H0Z29_11010 [Candidatus Marinimicrobia bacterium]|nr:hypothetical protein [Candidatus Neomarinimicrobiota bacterium]